MYGGIIIDWNIIIEKLISLYHICRINLRRLATGWEFIN